MLCWKRLTSHSRSPTNGCAPIIMCWRGRRSLPRPLLCTARLYLRAEHAVRNQVESALLTLRRIPPASRIRSRPSFVPYNRRMPKLTVEGYGAFHVAEGRRARARDRAGCEGGHPAKERLVARGLTGVPLSCQLLCDHDMTVRAISRLEGSGRPAPGGTPQDTITPPPHGSEVATFGSLATGR